MLNNISKKRILLQYIMAVVCLPLDMLNLTGLIWNGTDMRIGVLCTNLAYIYENQKSYMNNQNIGLAKALSKYFDEVVTYLYNPMKIKAFSVDMGEFSNVKVTYSPVRNIGCNGIVDVSDFDPTLDVMLYFSDTQMVVPRVAKWAEKNNVLLIPYVGAVESHSDNKLIRKVKNILTGKNLKVYRQRMCLAKTEEVASRLSELKINDVKVAHVGLDETDLKKDYSEYDVVKLKEKYGYSEDDKVILFVGRSVPEKEPVRMVRIFAEIYKRDNSYRLFMLGDGPLDEQIDAEAKKLGVSSVIRRGKLANSDIWEAYRICDTNVNLNQHEIFGMSILESMYYEAKVVAWEAAGPKLIIEDKISGYIAHSDEEVVELVMGAEPVGIKAHERIEGNFTWDFAAKIISDYALKVREEKV